MTGIITYIWLLFGAGACLVSIATMLVPYDDEVTANAPRRTKMRWAVSDMCFMFGACAVAVGVVLGLVEIVERIGGV